MQIQIYTISWIAWICGVSFIMGWIKYYYDEYGLIINFVTYLLHMLPLLYITNTIINNITL